MKGIETCIFCNTSSEMIGLEGLKPYEAYCPFCEASEREFRRVESYIKNLSSEKIVELILEHAEREARQKILRDRVWSGFYSAENI